MTSRTWYSRALLVGLLLLVMMAVPALPAYADHDIGPDRVYFPQTGHYLSYDFLSFWRHHGALPVFGYPISEEVADPATGRTLQYFERAVFEAHEGAPPEWMVQLQRLGSASSARADGAVAAAVADAFAPVDAPAAPDSRLFFAPTGHTLAAGFRDFWQRWGGLPVFGYPISEEFEDPATHATTQFFERSVFTWQPDAPRDWQVQLRQLGREAAARARVEVAPVPQDPAVPAYAPGLWSVPAPRTPADVRVPAAGAPVDQAKWIEVDLTNQYLRAWEYDRLQFGQYVSTGIATHPTPTGYFRVFSKLIYDDMTNGPAAPPSEYYYLPKVPYVLYFLAGGYAIHGTYWHHNFGQPMSHGCVNMTIDGAHWIYDWAPLGTTVWVH